MISTFNAIRRYKHVLLTSPKVTYSTKLKVLSFNTFSGKIYSEQKHNGNPPSESTLTVL